MSRRQRITTYIFLVLGLLATAYSCLVRIGADETYNAVRLLVDWHALNSIPDPGEGTKSQGVMHRSTPWNILAELPESYVCYGEETVGSLLDQGIIRPASMRAGAPTYEVALKEYESDIAKGASRHGYWHGYPGGEDGPLTVQFPDLPEEDLALVPVVWLGEVITAVREHGRGLILRPGGTEFLGEDGLNRTLEFCSGQDLVLFQGPTVLGYPGQLRKVADELQRNSQYFGWVEFDEQDGGGQLAKLLAPNVLRVHSIPPEEMVNYDTAGAVARYIRAARERNIRCLYIRPFVRGKVIGDPAAKGYRTQLVDVNKKYFRAIKDGLAKAGLSPLGPVNFVGVPPASPANPRGWIFHGRPLFLALAAGAVLVLLLGMWFPGLPRWAWTLLLCGTVLAGLAGLFMMMAYTAALLLAALVFPLWGFWLAMQLYQSLVARFNLPPGCLRRLLIALLALAVASMVTMAGGLVIHGAMWDPATMLKVGQFKGVTVALALPVLLLAAYAWHAETLADAYIVAERRLADYWSRFMALWNAPIRYGDVAFIMVALGVLGIVLMRSGNDSPLEVLSLETWFRDSLEQWFSVRPRTKELIGHPLMIVFLMSLPWRNRLSLLFALAALLGQVSILNTFCHLHTPLALTMERVLLGLGLGLASGLVWGIVVMIGNWFWFRYAKRGDGVGQTLPQQDVD